MRNSQSLCTSRNLHRLYIPSLPFATYQQDAESERFEPNLSSYSGGGYEGFTRVDPLNSTVNSIVKWDKLSIQLS